MLMLLIFDVDVDGTAEAGSPQQRPLHEQK